MDNTFVSKNLTLLENTMFFQSLKTSVSSFVLDAESTIGTGILEDTVVKTGLVCTGCPLSLDNLILIKLKSTSDLLSGIDQKGLCFLLVLVRCDRCQLSDGGVKSKELATDWKIGDLVFSDLVDRQCSTLNYELQNILGTEPSVIGEKCGQDVLTAQVYSPKTLFVELASTSIMQITGTGQLEDLVGDEFDLFFGSGSYDLLSSGEFES